jgi:hypothetical protein
MERFLLFDSGCSLCTELAHAIEHETDGRLEARSLRDPEVKTLLDRVRPGWRWEPTLLEVEGDRARASTGMAMRARLVMGLGLRRAWRTAQLVSRAGVPLVAVDLGRRRFLKLLGGSALATVLASLLPSNKAFADGGGDKISDLLKNSKIEELKGEEAQQLIEQALRADESLQLRAALPDFSPQSDGSRALSVSGPTYTGRVVAIPFKSKNNAEAFLFFSATNSKTESAMIALTTDGKIITGGDVYRVQGGVVTANQATIGSGASTAGVTGNCYNCMVSCLQAYGCSGYALAACMASMLLCPWFPPSCVIFATCVLYCGGAWSLCWTNWCHCG